jgi:GNAT superfamily N-acetyltransferase
MEISRRLAKIDPSRSTVYQLLDYIKDEVKIKLIQQETDNLFLIKTEPYVDSLYNYAHVLGKGFGADELVVINDFFGKDYFRIKTPANNTYADFLSNNGFTLRDTGYTMLAADLKNQNISYHLPVGVRIEAVTTEDAWKDFGIIFSQAFNKQIFEYEQKFGFLKRFALDKQEKNLRFFLLYENDIPVSSGGCYAFDKFSIENIGTLQTARGRGYAGLMVNFLLNEARRLGYNDACLVGSEEAASIYQKAGFEILSKTKTFINF